MTKLKLTASVLFFLISFSSEHQSQTPAKESRTGTATISGQVVLGGMPVPRVTVTLQDQYNYNLSYIRVKTDNDGRFFMSGISAGGYLINVVAPNYVIPGNRQDWRQGRILNVSEGERIENIEIELVRGGVISGKVTDSSGRPIVETYVSIVPVNQQGRQVSNQRQSNYINYFTDDRGFYRIYGIPAGLYRVGVGTSTQNSMGAMVSDGIYFPQTFHPDVIEETKAKLIDLSEGGEVTDVDIIVGELKKAYEVSGRVIDKETGVLVPNVTIRYGPGRTNDSNVLAYSSGGQRSNNRGEFALSGFVPGTYKLYVNSDDNGEYYSDPVTVEVTGGDVTGVELMAKRGGVISGVVIIDGVRDPMILSKISTLRMSVNSQSKPGGGYPSSISTRVNPDGTFRIRGLQSGNISFYLGSTVTELRGITIDRVEKDGVALPREFDFVQGQHLDNLRVVATYGSGVIRGKISVLGESLPPGIYLIVFAKKSGSAEARSPGFMAEVDARGQFLFEHLLPGEYTLTLSINSYPVSTPPGERKPESYRIFYEALQKARQQISVTNGAATQVTLVLDLNQKEGSR